MSFKNALKNFVAHFGVVWALLLYIVIFAAVIVGLSLPFILPITRAFETAGVFDCIGKAFSALINEGNFQGLSDGLFAAIEAARDVLAADGQIMSLFVLLITLILMFVFRFFLGLYEIPMTTVMDGQLSCNARYGFGGKFFSTLPLSVRYSFAKTIFTIVFDAAIYGIIYGLECAIGVNLWFAVAVMFVLLVFGALRFSLVACWAPCVVNGAGVLGGFRTSVIICFKRFGSLYSTYFIALMLSVALGIFISIFTLGVGLIVILPICATFVSYINVTEYYNKTGKRYYIDDAVFTPSTENVL